MGFKTYTCQICGEQVSKKKSLSLKELESRDGRACKHHDKVQELLEAEEKHQEELEYSKQADENIFVMFAVADIRVRHTVHGIPLHFLFSELDAKDISKGVKERIKKEVESQGAGMSTEEIVVSLNAHDKLTKNVIEETSTAIKH